MQYIGQTTASGTQQQVEGSTSRKTNMQSKNQQWEENSSMHRTIIRNRQANFKWVVKLKRVFEN